MADKQAPKQKTERELAQERVDAVRAHVGSKVWEPREWNQYLYDCAIAEGRRPNVVEREIAPGIEISRFPPDIDKVPMPNPNAPDAEQEAVRKVRESARGRNLMLDGGGIEPVKQ